MLKKLKIISMLVVLAISCTIGANEVKDFSRSDATTIQAKSGYSKQGIIYVPAKELLEQLDYTVSWEQAAKRLNINEGSVYITLNSKKVTTKSGDYMLEGAPEIKNGRFCVPLRFFADVLGHHVSYIDGNITMSGNGELGKLGRYEEKITKKTITISAAGDFTLGYYKGQASGGRFDEVAKANGYNYFMQNVKSVFENDDLTIINLEGPLTTRGVAAEKEFAIRGLPNYTGILKAGSIETVNLANNHTYDYGNVGYTDTITALNKEQIGYFGEDNIYYTIANDIKVAILGAKGWVSNQNVKNTLKKRIDEAKKQADLIIVEFHWGIERENYANSTQQDLAKYVIEQGANLVLGSHPHVIQGIGSYKGANIVYSMGNFCFGANKNPNDKDTFIYQETFALTADGIVSEGYEVIPCRISSSTSRNNYQPTILEGAEKARVLQRIETYSKNLRK